MAGQIVNQESPLILVDSGASRSVCGEAWSKWWNENESWKLAWSSRQFRFGAGPLIQSSGTVVIFIHVGEKCTDSNDPLILPVC